MAELGWTASKVMQEHLQNLVSWGYMMAAELVTCRVLEDPASPIQVSGYVAACATFYKWGFGILAHRFLHSLLQFYGLELHHLTLAFVTLCEAYIGIEPHFNLWNYFFHIQLQQSSGTKVVALDSVDIFVRSGHGVDPYFLLLTSGPLDGWWKV
jgi:hypothetical protein